MNIGEEGLNYIEEKADKAKDVKLLFLIQIMRELSEIKSSLNEKQYAGNNSNDGTDSSN